MYVFILGQKYRWEMFFIVPSRPGCPLDGKSWYMRHNSFLMLSLLGTYMRFLKNIKLSSIVQSSGVVLGGYRCRKMSFLSVDSSGSSSVLFCIWE